MKFCTHCEAEIAEGAVVCTKYGCSVGAIPKKQVKVKNRRCPSINTAPKACVTQR
jgi:uncharacterized membrane protein YvbJ